MDFGKAPEMGTIALIIITALITSLISTIIGVFGKKAAESLLDFILRPFRFIKESIYQWVAPRNPFSISLRSYKKHVLRSNLTRIENPVGPNLAVPLEHAFAPLKLISKASQESIDLFKYAATSYRCIVLGGPGTGKTTLMKSLVTGIYNGRSNEKLNDLIPVFVVLRNLAKNEYTIKQAIVSAFADYHFPGAERFIDSALGQGKMLIILDGLDEVGANREYVASNILSFCEHDDQQEHKNRLIVTCRETSYRTRDLQSAIPDIVQVEPFANHHMKVFLQGWPEHKGRRAIRLYNLIQNDPQIRDICRNPLLLTILTGLYLDTDNFEIPTSRDRFYKAAVEELLIHRPARRQIKQNFDSEDKRQILERVALDRLETVARNEDPEEFTHDAMRQKAESVLRQEKVDIRGLIKEMTEINGIIKPANEGSYTCAHRTIQEYFAAREARRRRETGEVVAYFGSRPELIEVLYFYCGLIDNIPGLTRIVNSFLAQDRWLEAGRCLVYTKEILDGNIIAKVATGLRSHITPGAEFKAELEVLSSLAQRPEPEFEIARKYLSEAIDQMAEGHGEKGASALESVLATSPEAAMKVIPVLLKHNEERLKAAAVQLLRDIGTDEALDQLVQLLKNGDPFIRTSAAKILAGMIKSRNLDLKERAVLLPERKDEMIWPLEAYFPGRLAIPIAESLNPSSDTGNLAIDYAITAINEKESISSHDKCLFINVWSRVVKDLRIQQYRQELGKLLMICAITLPIMLFLIIFSTQVYMYFANQALVITMKPLQLHKMESHWVHSVNKKASIIVEEIEQEFPPNASGWARILPWNWFVEPVIPDDKIETFKTLNELNRNPLDIYQAVKNLPKLEAISDMAASDKVADLQLAVENLRGQLPNAEGQNYLNFSPSLFDDFFLPVILSGQFLLGLSSLTRGKEGKEKYAFSRSDALLRYASFNRDIEKISWLLAPFGLSACIFAFSSRVSQGLLPFRFMPLIVPILISAIGWLLYKLPWPNNPYSIAVNDVALPKQKNKKEG